MYLRYFDGSTESVCRPWTKHIYLYIFPSFGMVLVWPRFSLYHVSLVSSPPVGYLFQSYGEFVFPPAWQTYTVSLFTAMVIMSRAFVQGKSNKSRPFCGVSWLIIQPAFPVLPVSCSITSDVLVFCSCWFEKVPIDFLLVGLSLIDYDTFLWEQT